MKDERVFLDNDPNVPNIIRSLGAGNMGWASALCELIDNSLGAGANCVTISCDGKWVRVQDDGRGASREGLSAMIRYGEHIDGGQKSISMYGIGGNEACLWMGHYEAIETCYNGEYWSVRKDWTRDFGPRLPIPTPKAMTDELARAVGLPITGGTRVSVRLKAGRRFPRGKALEALMSAVAVKYFWGLMYEGKQILFEVPHGRLSVKPYRLPERMDPIYEENGIEVAHGKRISINVGVVAPGEKNYKPGIAVVYRGRTIIDPGPYGCNGHSFSNVAGWVHLEGKWRPGRHKDHLADDGQDRMLREAIASRIRHVLEAGDKATTELRFETLSQAVARNIRAMIDGYRSGGVGGKGSTKRPSVPPTDPRPLVDPGRPGGGGKGDKPGGRAARDERSSTKRDPGTVIIERSALGDVAVKVFWGVNGADTRVVVNTEWEYYRNVICAEGIDRRTSEMLFTQTVFDALANHISHADEDTQRKFRWMSEMGGPERYARFLMNYMRGDVFFGDPTLGTGGAEEFGEPRGLPAA